MKRERLTITLDTNLLTAVDSLIDKDRLRNRSQTIEYLLKQGLGINQLDQAFLFFETDWQQIQVEKVITLLKGSRIRQLFLGASDRLADIKLLIQSLAPEFNLIIIPLDFGTGGSLVLQKTSITNPFLTIHLKPNLRLPETLLAPYLFHREHNHVATQLLFSSNGTDFFASGLAILNPEILRFITAGVTSLELDIFPELVKEHKMEGYVFGS